MILSVTMRNLVFGLFARSTNKAKTASCAAGIVAPMMTSYALAPCVVYQGVLCFTIAKSAITAGVHYTVFRLRRHSYLLASFERGTARVPLFAATSLPGVLFHFLLHGSFQFLAFSSDFSLLLLSLLLCFSIPSLLYRLLIRRRRYNACVTSLPFSASTSGHCCSCWV